MAGSKTTTHTNVYRCNATDTKKLAKLCGADIAPQSDKLVYVSYETYNDGIFIYLVPKTISYLKKDNDITSAERREHALLERLVQAGIATDADKARATTLQLKADGVAVSVDYEFDIESIDFDNDAVKTLFTELVMS